MTHYNEKCLYPHLEPYSTGMIDVGDGHKLYYEESGNKDGIPVVHFHGGPGYWGSPNIRRYFNPQKYRLIQFHQRGCGLSTPLGKLENNTTEHLTNDAEKLRKHLDIDKWMVFGGSWGASMSLVYAIAHPDRVISMLVYSVFLADEQWTDWYLEKNGAALYFPEAYEKLSSALDNTDNSVASKVLKNQDNDKIGNAIVEWENTLVNANFSMTPVVNADTPSEDFFDKDEEKKDKAHNAAGLIEMHYLSQNCFLKENHILDNLTKISHIPCLILQGRYDMVCPPKQAWLVHKGLEKSKIDIIDESGHATRNLKPYIVKALDRYNIDCHFGDY